jgi:2'-5' RNA ligase
MTLSGAGCFPNFRRPRVVWIGVKAHRTVFALAEDVEEACELLGFERDARGFTPHLTIGRVKKELAGAGASLERAAQSLHSEHVLHVSSLDLMQSELGPSGPKYRVLARLALTGRA